MLVALSSYPSILEVIQLHLPRESVRRGLKLRRYNKVFINAHNVKPRHEDTLSYMEMENVDVKRMLKPKENAEVKKIIAESYEQQLIINALADWELNYKYKFFQWNSCEVSGLLEFDPLKKRPSMSISLTLMVAISLPTSVLVMMLYLIDAANEARHLMHLRQDQ